MEYPSSYLPEYAQDDSTQRTFMAAKIACRENVDCIGITCAPDQDGLCTSRVGPNPKSSPNAEVSYVCCKYIIYAVLLFWSKYVINCYQLLQGRRRRRPGSSMVQAFLSGR